MTRPGSLFKWEAWRILLLQQIRIIIDNTNCLARKITQKWIPLTYL